MPIIKAGDKYNKLTAIRFVKRDKGYNQFWLFKCDCGNEKVIRVNSVKRGISKACGCFENKKNLKHGMKKTKIYSIWAGVKQRCLNKNISNYKNYGGRGITICPRWMKFENFFEDMGERPKGKTLDRIKNNLGYCKSNCKWSTPKEQGNNRRTNHLLTHKNKTQNVSQWAKELGFLRNTIFMRLERGWSVKKTLTTPINN